jgi:hypothetical protein
MTEPPSPLKMLLSRHTRRMGRYNLSGALAADRRQDWRTLRTHPTRRPREDIFCRSRTRYLLAGKFPCVLRRRSASRRNRGAVLAPAEFATIDPLPVQDHSQPPGDRDDRSAYPAPLSHPHAPRLQPRPFTGRRYNVPFPCPPNAHGASAAGLGLTEVDGARPRLQGTNRATPLPDSNCCCRREGRSRRR